MKKTSLLRAGTLVAFALVAGPAASGHGRNAAHNLEGVWLMEVTLRNCTTGDVAPVPNPIFPATNSFHSGGTMTEDGARGSPALRNTGQGIWRRTGARSFESRFQFHLFDANGFFSGTQSVTRSMKLSADGKTLSVEARVTITAPGGAVLVQGCASETGQRLGW